METEDSLEEIAARVEEYEKMKPGELIANPQVKIAVGCFSLTHRALKHFVERRIEQRGNIQEAVANLFITAEKPEIIAPNKYNSDGFILGRKIPNVNRALMLVIDKDNTIASIHFKKIRDFNKIKNSLIASGGAADPSSFLPKRISGNLAASLSTLQARSVSSLPISLVQHNRIVNQNDIFEIGPAEFPGLLREINDPPKRLFVRGTLPPADAVFLCVVGSRNYSRYGHEASETLIVGLAHEPQSRRADGSSRIIIVSGLAIGIDAIAHQAALSAGLPTIALPGSGLNDDVLYPRANHKLAQKILRAGGALLSEFAPDWRARPESFPQRNRLMAGASHAVLVIEAEQKSGTMITARLATEYNRDVLAVPGSIFSRHSTGGHWLISQGARLVATPADIVDALGLTPPSEPSPVKTAHKNNKKNKKDKTENLELFAPKDSLALIRRFPMATPDELAILAALIERGEPLGKDELAERTNLSIVRVNIAITLLELGGHIKVSGGLVRI